MSWKWDMGMNNVQNQLITATLKLLSKHKCNNKNTNETTTEINKDMSWKWDMGMNSVKN